MARYANPIRLQRPPDFQVSKVLSVLAVLVAPIVSVPSITQAAPIKLEFVPPKIDATQVCIARPPDTETVARWENWDGLRLPEARYTSFAVILTG